MRPTFYLALTALLALSAAPDAQAASPGATPDPAVGKRLFLRCASCHGIADTTDSKIGPNLRGVVGRASAALPTYAYSPAMKEAHVTWDEVTLDRWLARPTDVVPGTSMAFAGLTKPDERQAVIAYLKTTGQ